MGLTITKLIDVYIASITKAGQGGSIRIKAEVVEVEDSHLLRIQYSLLDNPTARVLGILCTSGSYSRAHDAKHAGALIQKLFRYLERGTELIKWQDANGVKSF